MNKSLKEKIIKARTIQIIVYLVIGLLCGGIVYSAITAYKNSLKIDGLKEIKIDIKNIKESMVNIGEKVGMKPNELTGLVSPLQGGEIEKKQPFTRKVVGQQKKVTSGTIEATSIPDEEVEPSITSLRERLKSYEARLEKSTGPSEAKMVEEATEPVPAKAPEENLRIPRAKTIKSETAPITKQKYHIVQRGETLSHIGRKYDISVDKLGKLNNIDPSQLIRPGQKLLVTKDSRE
jgi:LysM repeat protein